MTDDVAEPAADPFVDRVEASVGRLDDDVRRELSANPEIYRFDRSLLHGTMSSAIPGLAADGRLRAGDDLDADPAEGDDPDVVSRTPTGERGDLDVVSTTTTFGLAEFYARDGTPSVSEVAPGVVDEDGEPSPTDARAGAGDAAAELADLVERVTSAREAADPTEATAGARPGVDEAEWRRAVDAAPESVFPDGLDGETDRAADDLWRAAATADDVPVVVEAPAEAAERVRVDAEAMPGDLDDYPEAERLSQPDDGILTAERWLLDGETFADVRHDELPATEAESASTATNSEVVTTGVDLSEATVLVSNEDLGDDPLETLAGLRERYADAPFEVGMLEARAAVRDHQLAEAGLEEVGRPVVSVSYVRNGRRVDRGFEPAPDVGDPTLPTPPTEYTPVRDHADGCEPTGEPTTGDDAGSEPTSGDPDEAAGPSRIVTDWLADEDTERESDGAGEGDERDDGPDGGLDGGR